MMREAVADAAGASDPIALLLLALGWSDGGRREWVLCDGGRQAYALRCHGCCGQPLTRLFQPSRLVDRCARSGDGQAAAFSMEATSMGAGGSNAAVAHGRALELGHIFF